MEYGEHRPVAQERDRVVAPFAGGDLAAIEIEDAEQFAAIERDAGSGGPEGLAPGGPRESYRLKIAQWRLQSRTIIAPPGRADKPSQVPVPAHIRGAAGLHGFVSEFTMSPDFGPGHA